MRHSAHFFWDSIFVRKSLEGAEMSPKIKGAQKEQTKNICSSSNSILFEESAIFGKLVAKTSSGTQYSIVIV